MWMMFCRRAVRCLLVSLTLLILDDRPTRFSCGYTFSTNIGQPGASAPVVTSKACWIFSHMPKSGGVSIQSLLKHYARSHGLVLGRYDTEKWVKGSAVARSFLDADYDLIGGGYVDGLRPHGGQNCKWFTMFRHPISRLVSAYFYCKKAPKDQLCATGVLDARDTDFRSFARHWGNFGLRQFAQAFLWQDSVLQDALENDTCTSADPRICPGWFKIKEYFEKQQPATTEGEGWPLGTEASDDLGLHHLLQPVEEMLRTNYTAVGILENWDASMALFTKALQLPDWDWQTASQRMGALNSNKAYRAEANSALEEAWTDPEIREIIWLDLLLYDHAVAIFNKQMVKYSV